MYRTRELNLRKNVEVEGYLPHNLIVSAHKGVEKVMKKTSSSRGHLHFRDLVQRKEDEHTITAPHNGQWTEADIAGRPI